MVKIDFELRIIDGSKETPLREPSHVYVRGGNTKKKPAFFSQSEVSRRFFAVY